MSIEARQLSKTFGKFVALKDVSLQVPTGELVALLGPSGSGKTTLLRIIAGLEVPDAGSGPILFHGQDVARRGVGQRNVGFVFQHYALFRHMTVFENIAFGLKVRPRKLRPSRQEIRDRVQDLLKLMLLENLATRYPAQLSGGQRQRVALARALAIEPQVLLLDEPFGALDAKVRQELRRWLRRLHDEIHLTSLFVTHDQDEALEVADRVVVMNQGRIEQVGSPEDVFHHPASEFVLNFLGHVNLFHGRVEDGKAIFGTMHLDYAGADGNGSARLARLFVRPHDFAVGSQANGSPGFYARVTHVNLAGPRCKLEFVSDLGSSIEVEIPHDRQRELNLSVGSEVFLSPQHAKVFAEDYSI